MHHCMHDELLLHRVCLPDHSHVSLQHEYQAYNMFGQAGFKLGSFNVDCTEADTETYFFTSQATSSASKASISR